METQRGSKYQYLRLLVPKTRPEWFLEPEAVNIGYLDPLGSEKLSNPKLQA